jgi:hypothetical protein
LERSKKVGLSPPGGRGTIIFLYREIAAVNKLQFIPIALQGSIGDTANSYRKKLWLFIPQKKKNFTTGKACKKCRKSSSKKLGPYIMP